MMIDNFVSYLKNHDIVQYYILDCFPRDKQELAIIIMQLDLECYNIALNTEDEMVALIKLAWWKDNLLDPEEKGQYPHPLIDKFWNNLTFIANHEILLKKIDKLISYYQAYVDQSIESQQDFYQSFSLCSNCLADIYSFILCGKNSQERLRNLLLSHHIFAFLNSLENELIKIPNFANNDFTNHILKDFLFKQAGKLILQKPHYRDLEICHILYQECCFLFNAFSEGKDINPGMLRIKISLARIKYKINFCLKCDV